MRRRWLVPRYSIRTLLIAVAAIAVGLWSYLYLPGILHNRQDRLSRAAIDPYELSIAGHGDPAKAPPELVAILGDSRLKHWDDVCQVDFGAGGTIVSHGSDACVCFWDSVSGKRKRVFAATAVGVARQGTRAFLAEGPGQVLVWDLVADAPLRRLRMERKLEIGCIAANDDGTLIAVEFKNRSHGDGRGIEVWSVNDPKLLKSIPIADGVGECLTITPDGNLIAYRENRAMKIVSTMAASPAVVLGPLKGRYNRPDGFRQADFDDDAHLITTTVEGRIIVWDAETGEQFDEIPRWGGSLDGLTTNAGRSEIATCNSNRASVLSGTVENKNWHERIELIFPSGNDNAYDVALSSNNWAVAHGDHTISLWDPSRPGMKARITGGEGIEATCAVFHPSGQALFTAGRSGEVTAWKVGTWKKLRSWEAHTTEIVYLTMSPDGAVLATSGQDKTVILWNAATGQELRVHPALISPAPVSFSWDGAWYAIPGGQFAPYQILVNEVHTGKAVAAIPTAKGNPPAGFAPFSPTGDTILVGGNEISHFDVIKKALIATFGKKSVQWPYFRAVWFADGRRAAIGTTGSDVVIWDLATHKPSMTLRGNTGMVKSIALSPDERRLAACGWSSNVCIWNTGTGAIVKSGQIGPPKGVVEQVAFSPDGRYLATVNGIGTAYILRLDGIAGGTTTRAAAAGEN